MYNDASILSCAPTQLIHIQARGTFPINFTSNLFHALSLKLPPEKESRNQSPQLQ